MKWRRKSASRQFRSKDERLARAYEVLGRLADESQDLDRQQFFELYKIMVESSEALVARRQQVNTFFLTMNGLLLTALGFFIRAGGGNRVLAAGVAVLGVAGGVLAGAWRSLLISFGQLNTGKCVVVNRMESFLPAAIFSSEWEALDQGENPEVYRTFTSREVWVPNACIVLYVIVVGVALTLAAGWWKIN